MIDAVAVVRLLPPGAPVGSRRAAGGGAAAGAAAAGVVAGEVQGVLPPGGGPESWTVIGSDLRPVEPVERYLAWLSRIERSPNTVRAYAQDLKTFWAFLEGRGLAWDRVTLEQLGQFTGWLRRPADNVIVLASGTPRRSARTVNRMLAAVCWPSECDGQFRTGTYG